MHIERYLLRYIKQRISIGKINIIPIIILSGLVFMPNAEAQDYQRLENMCKACHGETGENGYTVIPDLKWQNNAYLIQQLTQFKNGQRTDMTMAKVAQLLSKDDIEQLAEYFYSVSQNTASQPLSTQ
jgi:cytochrome c553